MASRRKEKAAAIKRGTIAPAPKEETPIEEVTDKEEKKTERVSIHTDESVLAGDFKALEGGVFGGESKDTLADMQKAFSVDQMTKQSEVDAWNYQEIKDPDGKVIGKSSQLIDILDGGKSYEAPFPSDPVFYPDSPAKMRLRFDQENFMLRQSQMIDAQLTGHFCMAFDLETKSWADRYKDIALGRKDSHIIVHSIKLCSRNTKGLPFSSEVTLYTGTSLDSMLRQWHTDDAEGHTAGTLGVVTGAVVEPDENTRDRPMLLYHASMDHLTNPWMSRFMTFNFDKLREIMNTQHRHGKNDNYYKIKAPPKGATFKEYTPVQWLTFSFFRYLKWATQRQMDLDKSLDASFSDKMGTSVIQALDKTGDSYQFVISKSAFDRVVNEIQQKVRPAVHMANLEHIVLALNMVGGKETARKLQEKAMLQRDMRDELETDPIVGPMNFVVEIGYIAIPADYPMLESQTETSTGAKFHHYKKYGGTSTTRVAGGYGSYGYAAAARKA